MRGMELRFGILRRIGADERNVPRIGERDQVFLAFVLYLLPRARDLDIEAVTEQRLQGIAITLGSLEPASREQPGERALVAAGKADQAIGMAAKRFERDVGIEFERTFEVSAADEIAQVEPSLLALGKKGKPVDRQILPLRHHTRPCHCQERSDDRLNPRPLARLRISRRAVKAVAIADGGGRKLALLGELGGCLGIDRTVQHRETREDAERNERCMSHRRNLGIALPLNQGGAGDKPGDRSRRYAATRHRPRNRSERKCPCH